MAKKNKAQDNIPSVMSFERKLAPSDGRMYGTTWESRRYVDRAESLEVTPKTVRGTISSRLKKKNKQADPTKLDSNIENPNPHCIDTCALKTGQDTLKLHFTLKVLGGIDQPAACNKPDFKQSYTAAVNDYIAREGFRELAKRYAINIANGRFLWRNRVGAEKIEVYVNELREDRNEHWAFDSTQYSTRNFNVNDGQIDSLAERIANVLCSSNDFLMLDITCYAKVGKAQEVFPSEEMVFDKGKGDKSKQLYSVDNIAAMHAQKIGNALRTIDTWYSDFNDPEKSVGPIAIEPYGAVTNLGKAFRKPKHKQDFFTFFDRFAQGEKLERIEDEHYVMAVVLRGGVFGESKKQGEE